MNTLDALLASLVSCLVGLYAGYRLDLGKSVVARRRIFRDKIRSISLRFDAVNWMTFIKTYEESVPEVKNACIEIWEDISFWNRSRFTKFRDKYCGFKQSDLELPRTQITPAKMPEYMTANKKKRAEMTVDLQETLKKIMQYAK